MRERRYGAKGERACKPNCKFFCRLDCRYTCKYTYKYLEFFLGKMREGGKRGGGVGRLVGFRTSRLISIWDFFPQGRRTCGRGVAKGALVFS